MPATRRPAATRQLLLDAAFDEIHRRGFQAASLDEILSRTGVTKGALYHHFASKRELGLAVVEEKLGKALLQNWLLPLQDAEDPVDALQAQLRRASEGLSDEGLELGCPIANLAQEMSPVDEEFRRRIHGLYQLWRDALADLLERGQKRGRVRKDADPAAAAAFIVAAIAGGRVVGKSAKDREVLRRCVAELGRYLEALRPPRSPRRR